MSSITPASSSASTAASQYQDYLDRLKTAKLAEGGKQDTTTTASTERPGSQIDADNDGD